MNWAAIPELWSIRESVRTPGASISVSIARGFLSAFITAPEFASDEGGRSRQIQLSRILRQQ